MAIIPVPTTRVSDVFVRQRLLTQVQLDQRELYRVQTSLTTGRRIILPSEDAPAALRAISLQRLLERKTQVASNVETSQSYLSATDTALRGVSDILANVRATAIAVTGATATDVQRTAAVQEVKRALDQLLAISNQNFRGRFLFSGGKVNETPFEATNAGIVYQGDQQRLKSYSDLNALFDTNVAGDEIFGGLSTPLKAPSDLNPALTYTTPLALLRGGQGISAGSILVSDGSSSSVVDLSSARTIGDVARLIETNPPAGRTVTVTVNSTGLRIELDAAGGGNLTISEVGGGITARELGIHNSTGVGVGPLNGTDLDPQLALTTPLADLLGSRAFATVTFAGTRNDLIIEAGANGTEFNGVTVTFVDDSAYQAGAGISLGDEFAEFREQPTAAVASLRLAGPANDLLLTANQAGAAMNGVSIDIVDGGAIGDAATASYDPVTKRLTLTIDSANQTSVDTLIAAINTEGTFTATRDATNEANVGGGVIPASNVGVNRGSTKNTGGDANTLFVHIAPGQTTATQVINAINAEGTFRARINQSELNNDASGPILDSFADPGSTVTLAGGGGVNFDKQSGLRILSGDQTYDIDFTTAETVEDMLNILNGSDAGIHAEIDPTRRGITIRTRISGADFAIGENGGVTAAQLGVRTFDTQTTLASLNYGRGVNQVNGADFTIRRKDGVELEIDLEGAATIQDVIDRINNHPANTGDTPVVAQLVTQGNGIEIVASGAGPMALEIRRANNSEAAWDLGLLPPGKDASDPPAAGVVATSTLSSAGVNNDLRISAASQGEHLNGVVVQFVDSGLGAGNETVTYDPVARTLTFDVDQPTATANRIISVLESDPVASQLFAANLVVSDGLPNDGSGLIDLNATATLTGGAGETLTSTDVNPIEVQGVFTALKVLQDALAANDLRGIERAVAMIDDSMLTINYVRAEVGARQQALDVVVARLEVEDTELRSQLSNAIDVDLAEAISEFTGRQAALEASLRTAAQIYQLTLLNFL